MIKVFTHVKSSCLVCGYLVAARAIIHRYLSTQQDNLEPPGSSKHFPPLFPHRDDQNVTVLSDSTPYRDTDVVVSQAKEMNDLFGFAV
jgi:hypothetical protein